MEDTKLTYKDAGVDTKEGERAVSLMKEHVKGTFNKSVLTGLGSFGSLMRGVLVVDTGNGDIIFAQGLLRNRNLRGEERLTVVDQLDRAGLTLSSRLDEGNRGTSEGNPTHRYSRRSA